MFEFDLPDLQDLRVAHLGEYFGAWAIAPAPFRMLVDHARGIDLTKHVDHHRELLARQGSFASGVSGYPTAGEGEIAVIDLSGVLMKYPSSIGGGSSTVAARAQIRAAARSENVSGIVLRIDSPGGTVSGTKDLADDVAAAATLKPVFAYAEDQCLSAAYWISARATKVFANPTALVGSIGTYATILDSSGAAKMDGIVVHVVRAGEFKGMGQPGTEVTPAHLDELQRVIDQLNAHFVAGVAAGRKLDGARAQALADGRAHLAADAVRLGLIDGVQTFDQVMTSMIKLTARPAPIRAELSTMQPIATGTPIPGSYEALQARLSELQTACPGASPGFLWVHAQDDTPISEVRRLHSYSGK